MTAISPATTTPSPAAGFAAHDPELAAAVEAACKRIAPLWPLKHFVAVNPFLGFTGEGFAATCATMERVARTRMLMPRPFYAQAIRDGVVGDADIQAALRVHPIAGMDTASVMAEAAGPGHGATETPPAVVATVAEVLDRIADGDRYVSHVAFMIDEISAFCAGYFDEGQASWRMPKQALRPYAAWRALIVHDRNPETLGIRNFRASVLDLPGAPLACIGVVAERLGIPERALEDYLFRALFDIGGWAAYARYIGWNAELDGRPDDTLVELLAIRLAWGWGLFEARSDRAFVDAWAAAMEDAGRLPRDHDLGETPGLAVDVVLQEAYEIAHRRRLLAKLVQVPMRAAASVERPSFQAAFCIDVRSEIFRRALEAADANIETVGFAGFFGFPIEYVTIGHAKGGAQCPVLLKPSFVVCETVKNASERTEAEIMGLRLLRRRAAKAWKSFKLSAVSSFSFVETVGLGFAAKIATDSAGLTRPAPSPSADGLDRDVARRIGPRLAVRDIEGRATGFAPDQRLAMAEAVLRAMSMTGPFARLVLLAGHGSTTVNNPHATGLDCGACGGHTGEANARVAADILNDPDVRRGLSARGIVVPDDTWFLGALHDTTTDEVRIFDIEALPPSRSADLALLTACLAKAASLARLERSVLLGLEGAPNPGAAVVARSRDWSQVRPEWGLAGNAAFVAAPRSMTQGRDLGGRAFLHSYEHALDNEYGVLELIMTAPMVVASWINLQYYGSTVNNAVFGSGNKVLHNVVGQLGVLEGNAGDLRVGLPWQSVHDGTKLVHEPLRLNVLIAAPEAAMDVVMAKHPGVADLIANGWVFLHSLSDDGTIVRRCIKPGDWRQA